MALIVIDCPYLAATMVSKALPPIHVVPCIVQFVK